MIIGGSLFAASQSFAEVEGEVALDYATKYEFRGVDLGDDLFDATLGLSNEFDNGVTLSGGAWFATTQDAADFKEVDLFAEVSKEFGAVTLAGGYVWYSYPGQSGDNYHELYASAATTQLGLDWELLYAYVIDSEGDNDGGGYLEATVGKSFAVNECVSIDTVAGAAWSFGYNAQIDDTQYDGFNHWFVGVSAPWEVRETVTITPYVKYVDADSEIKNAAEEEFIGGVSLAVSF
ncbi:hypothetical protein [Persicirhabdus sediminis]|uniref:Uncharacterized protein n=1 Tax=Persicirhabdus sediminis TaxID=454144 RepID=A0A8J7MCT7_9BACT|nr:hypothetical protein [Persicirhabdus sediminis]MBK1790967.1 hypothetical protein [Persicirhabdus sediminis]